ncbi:hypothetical protein [Enterocloster sp.]|uniref:hypothetical protein n=1 Tax=Enterocloster sp. TaxID=2719315 RepID=UPI0039A38096
MSELIVIGVDAGGVNAVFKRLESKEQAKALRSALSLTANQARATLSDQAQNTYTVKNAGFKKSMRISATSKYTVIRAEGAPLPLKDFKVSTRGKTVRAQVLKRGHLKPLVKGDIKAFVNNIADKNQVRKKDSKKGKAGSKVRHIAVAQREGKQRLGINAKFSNSIPAMLGSAKRVYGVVEPEIGKDLQNNLRMFIDKALERNV